MNADRLFFFIAKKKQATVNWLATATCTGRLRIQSREVENGRE